MLVPEQYREAFTLEHIFRLIYSNCFILEILKRLGGRETHAHVECMASSLGSGSGSSLASVSSNLTLPTAPPTVASPWGFLPADTIGSPKVSVQQIKGCTGRSGACLLTGVPFPATTLPFSACKETLRLSDLREKCSQI